jgi:flavin-dependent dehydrogenase
MIPIGEGKARIGMCGITDLSKKFSTFIHPFAERCTHFVSGTIPLGMLKRTYDEGVLIVGDAAALAKPTSGGGVYTGARSAFHAAETTIKAIETGKTQADSLKDYEYAWKKDFGHELQKGFTLLNIRQKITKTEMEKIITSLSDPLVKEKIISKGDMDRPSKLIKSLLFNSHMLPAYYQIGKALIRGINDKF